MPERTTPPQKSLISPRRLIYLGLMLLLLYIVVPRLPGFLLSWDTLRQINPWWVAISIGSFGCSFLFSAGVYRLLSHGRMPYRRTVIVQIAATFLDRLLPAGSGALGVNYLYARKQHFDNAQAIAIATANNLIGVAGHLILLSVLVVAFPSTLQFLNVLHFDLWKGLIVGIAILGVLLAVALLLPRFRDALMRNGLEVIQTLLKFFHRPATLVAALGLSMGTSLSYVASLYFASLAMGVPLTPLQAFIVLTASVTAATFVPTPGGLGSAEAGTVAGLIGFGATAHDALGVTLLFRFVTFWLALIIGVAAFTFVERRGIIDPLTVRKPQKPTAL